MGIPDNVRQFLAEKPRQGVVATLNADGTPHQTVMWFDVKGDTVLLNTKRGRVKERNLSANPVCSICVEDGFRFVTLLGKVTLDDNPEKSLADILHLLDRYVRDPGQRAQMVTMFSAEPRLSLHLSVEQVISQGL